MKIDIWTIKDDMPERIHGKQEYKELAESIRKNGLIQPIVLDENNKLLAGRRRLRALRELQYGELTEGKEFVKMQTKNNLHKFDIFLEENIKRKNLDDVELGKFLLIRKQLYETEHPETRAQVRQAVVKHAEEPSAVADSFSKQTAEQYGVSERWVREKVQASKILETKPQLADLKSAKKIIRENKIQEQRAEIEKETFEKPEGDYDVIVIDPPWNYQDDSVYDADGFRGTCPYPTMSIEQIKNIKLPAKDDCVLWLWTTNKHIFYCKELCEAWGFEIKSILTWDKEHIAIGRWLRSQTEHCILAIKGKPYYQNTKFGTLLKEKRGEHSAKPQSFYKMVEEICAGRKLDYFARKKREGWDVYGDEV